MSRLEVLGRREIADLFDSAVAGQIGCDMNYLAAGKWYRSTARMAGATSDTFQVEVTAEKQDGPFDLRIDQPVGINFKQDSNTYIFETVVVGVEDSVNQAGGGSIILELPGRVERVERRDYTRIDTPGELNVQVMFWHRGHTDQFTEVPVDNYWEGRLANISLGGGQMNVGLEQKPNFRIHQVVGMQFTPMSYEKPILLEAHVVYLSENAETESLTIGVEFLGLEAAGQAREKLNRLKQIIKKYEQMNKQSQTVSAGAPDQP